VVIDDIVPEEESTRERIVAAAARLLETGGRDAVSTRAVSAAAGVQAPTIYRLFGDKQGLLDAVAVAGFTRYLASKTMVPVANGGDPVDALRAGWDLHVELGVANPALYTLMYDDHRAGTASPAALAAAEVLAARIHQIAAAGRLRVSEKQAVQLVHAAGHGTTLILIALPEHERESELSRIAREAVIAAITTTAAAAETGATSGLVNAAVTLRARLADADDLTGPERMLMQEWLDRIASTSSRR
jgi:AcrR family transcriptional regulator